MGGGARPQRDARGMDDMSDISPIGRPNAAALNGSAPAATRVNGSVNGTRRSTDSVELSDAALYLSQLKDGPQVRESLVNRIRSEIASGTYDTDAKLNAAIDAMIEDLA